MIVSKSNDENENNKMVETKPSLFYASQMLLNDKYSPLLKMTATDPPQEITRYSSVSEEFEAQLKKLLDELFDPDVTFKQVENREACTLCDYNKICKR